MAYIMRKEQKELPINHNGPKDFRWHRSKWLTDAANATQIDVGIVSLYPRSLLIPVPFSS